MYNCIYVYDILYVIVCVLGFINVIICMFKTSLYIFIYMCQTDIIYVFVSMCKTVLLYA